MATIYSTYILSWQPVPKYRSSESDLILADKKRLINKGCCTGCLPGHFLGVNVLRSEIIMGTDCALGAACMPFPHGKVPSQLSAGVGIVGCVRCHDERRSLVAVLCAAIQTVVVVVELQDPADAGTGCLGGTVGCDISLAGCGGASSLRSIGYTRALIVLSLLASATGCQARRVLDVKGRLAIIGIVFLGISD